VAYDGSKSSVRRRSILLSRSKCGNLKICGSYLSRAELSLVADNPVGISNTNDIWSLPSLLSFLIILEGMVRKNRELLSSQPHLAISDIFAY
jgi:hypothetical protein